MHMLLVSMGLFFLYLKLSLESSKKGWIFCGVVRWCIGREEKTIGLKLTLLTQKRCFLFKHIFFADTFSAAI